MLSLSLTLVLALAGPAPAADAFLVVVHPDARIESVSRAELSKIFLGRLGTWSDGTPALPVDQLPGRPARRWFSRRVHGRSVVSVEVYWKRRIFSGRGVPPAELDSDRQVLEFVHDHPGAVGYVGSGQSLAGVRELALED